MLLTIKHQMELKSEVDATGMNFGRNLISFLLNLEKYLASHNTLRKVIYDAQEISDHQKKKQPYFFVL